MLPPPWPWPLRTTPLSHSLSLSLPRLPSFLSSLSLSLSFFLVVHQTRTTHSNPHVSYTCRKRLTNRGHAARTTSTSSPSVSREPVGSRFHRRRRSARRYIVTRLGLRLTTHTFTVRPSEFDTREGKEEARTHARARNVVGYHSDRFSPRSNRSLYQTFSAARNDTARISTCTLVKSRFNRRTPAAIIARDN